MTNSVKPALAIWVLALAFTAGVIMTPTVLATEGKPDQGPRICVVTQNSAPGKCQDVVLLHSVRIANITADSAPAANVPNDID